MHKIRRTRYKTAKSARIIPPPPPNGTFEPSYIPTDWGYDTEISFVGVVIAHQQTQGQKWLKLHPLPKIERGQMITYNLCADTVS